MVKSLRLGFFFLLISLSLFFFIRSNEEIIPVFSNLEEPPWVEQQLTHYLQQPVHVGNSHFYWKGLLHPSLSINNLSVLSSQGNESLHIDKLSISINLIESLFKRKWIPGDITLQGAKFILREKGNGIIDINEIPTLQADLKNTHSEKLDALIDAFLSSGHKSIQNVDIVWYDQNGKVMLPFTKINITGNSHALVHSFSGTTFISQNTPVDFSGVIYGSSFAKKMLYTKIAANVHELDLPSNLLIPRLFKRFAIVQGKVGGQVNFLAKPHHNFSFRGNVIANQLQIKNNETQKTYPVTQLSTHYNLHTRQNIWSVALHNLQLSIQGKVLPIHTATFKQDNNGASQKLLIQLNLFPIEKMLNYMGEYKLLSPNLNSLMDQTKPTGNIKDFSLQLEKLNEQQAQVVSFSGELQNVGFNPYQRFPGVANLSGKINFNPESGNFILQSNNWLLNLPHVFRRTLPISESDAEVTWNFNKLTQQWLINIKKYHLTTKEGHASGYMKILMPKNHINPEIKSRATFEITNLTNAGQYYPYTIMPKSVVTWLDKAIKQGKVQGTFILNGKMKDFPFDKGKGEFLISGDLTDGFLHYRDNWPDVSHLMAKLVFHGRSMTVTGKKAEILGAEVKSVSAQINNLEKALLLIRGQLQTGNNQTIKVDQQYNPFSHQISFEPLKAFNVQGPLQLAINLTLPLNGKLQLKPHYHGNVLFNKVNLSSATSDLTLQNLRGHFFFADNEAHTQLLTGKIQSQPFKMTVNTIRNVNGDQQSEMNLDSALNVIDLQKYFKTPILGALTGITPFHANLKIIHSTQKQLSLAINSDLQGIQSTLPLPLTKEATSSWPSQFNLMYSNNGLGVSFALAKQLTGVLAFNKQEITQGNIHFGSQPAKMPIEKDLIIDGEIDQFDWSLWKKYFQTNNQEKKSADNLWMQHFPKLALNFKTIKLADISFTPLKLFANRLNNVIDVAVESPNLKGTIKIPTDHTIPVRANLDVLTIPKDQTMQTELNPTDIPALDLSINNLHFHDKFVQNLTLKVVPKNQDLLIKQLLINEQIFRVEATGLWRKINDQQQTSLSGDFSSNNLGAFLNQWHVTDNVIKGHGNSTFSLSWSNTPIDPELKSLQGTMNIHFNQGRIIKLGSQVDFGMGIGRMLNLLSLQTIPRRLKGDFSDLTGSGFSFDDLNGLLQFKQGNLYTDNSVLDGTVGKVKIKGRIGLAKKDYNLRLKINPNVTSSLPIVATLTAGPIAGLVTWVADKVLSHQVKQMTEIHYNVTGTWDIPSVVEGPPAT